MKIRKKILPLLLLLVTALLAACGPNSRPAETGEASASGKDAVLGSSREVLRIVSGSENSQLEPLLQEFANQEHIQIEMTYKGSLDIMRLLGDEEIPYDAVWPASSLWISTGDTKHRIKHAKSVSVTPVVFGIRQSLAEELGFTDREVSVDDLLQAIQSGKLRFCMTSATQSNSGASAYIGFLYALSGNPEVITSEDLADDQLRTDMRNLLSGVDRSSGSSDWLKDMFVAGDYNAMVNYECLIIQANQELEEQGKETLYAVYPYDGLSLADSPLGWVDNGDEKQEELFLKLQEYLFSESDTAHGTAHRLYGYLGRKPGCISKRLGPAAGPGSLSHPYACRRCAL